MTQRCKSTRNSRNPRKISSNLPLVLPDWTILTSEEPFLNYKTNEYNITIRTQHESPGNEVEKRQRLEEAKEAGVRKLFEVFHKVESEDDIQKIIDISSTPEHFIPRRPNPEGTVCVVWLVLVAVPRQQFDLIPYKSDLDEDEELPFASREITIESALFRDEIVDASNVLRGFHEEIENSDIEVTGIDLEKEATELNNFVFALERHLITNGYRLREDENDFIIIGTNGKYNDVLYVLIDEGDGPINLNIHLNQFKRSKPVRRPSTLAYVDRRKRIAFEGEEPATEFLNNNAQGPVTINPSSDNRLTLRQKDRRDSGGSIDGIIRRMNDKSSKTDAEKRREDEDLNNPALHQTILTVDGDGIDFAGDAVANDLKGALENVNDLFSLFEEILNKISLEAIIQQAMFCFLPDPCELVKALLRRLPCDKMVEILANSLGIQDILEFNFIQDEYFDSISICVAQMSQQEQDEVIGRYNRDAEVSVTIDSLAGIDQLNPRALARAIGGRAASAINNACDKHRNRLIEQLSESDCRKINILPKIPKLRIPTFKFPDNLPTIDIMGFISAQLEVALLEAITAALLEMVKAIIRDLLENCQVRPSRYGEIPLDNLISLNIDAGIGIETNINIPANIIEARLDVASTITPIDDENQKVQLMDMVDDLFAVITPGEFSDLLDGDPRDEILDIATCLIDGKYPNLKDLLSDQEKIRQIFENLGNTLDKGPILKQISDLDGVIGKLKPNEICEIESLRDNIDRELLTKKGVSEEDINEQINQAKQRRIERLAELADLLNNDNLLNNVVPPAFCSRDENGNSRPGIVPQMPPSFMFMLDETVNTIYEGVHMTFNQEINSLAATLTTPEITQEFERRVKKTKTVSFRDRDGNRKKQKVINPEYTRLVSQGVSVDDKEPMNPDENGDKVITVKEEDPIADPRGKNFVAQGLRNNLISLEFNDNLFSVTSEGARFIIPAPSDARNILNLAQRTEMGDPNFSENLNILNRVLNETTQLASNIPSAHYVDYIPGSVDKSDSYSFSIKRQFEGINNRTEELFSFSNTLPIDNDVLKFIENRPLQLPPSTPAPAGYFGDFMSRIWYFGPAIYRKPDDNRTFSLLPGGSNQGTTFVNNIIRGINVGNKPSYSRGVGTSTNRVDIFNDNPDVGVRGTFKNEQYYQVFRDIAAKFATEIAKSPLFRSDVFSSLDFLQVPLNAEGQPVTDSDCDPHLLDLDKIKKMMKDELMQTSCEEELNPIVDGLGSNNKNPIERSGITGAIITFCRLYAIEVVLSSIFVFNSVKTPENEEMENIISNYMADRMLNDLTRKFQQKDPEFFAQFSKETIRSYNEMVVKKQIEATEETNSFNVAVSYFIKTQLKDVTERIAKIIGSQDLVGVSKNDYHRIFIEQWVPLFDVAKRGVEQVNQQNPNNARFSSLTERTFLGNFVRRSSGERPLTNIPTPIFNLENGNFILEKYIRIEEKQGSILNNTNIVFSNSRGIQGRPGYQAEISVERPRHLFGVVNLDEWQAFVREVTSKARSAGYDLKWENEFSKWSYGLRLVFVPPVKSRKDLLTGRVVDFDNSFQNALTNSNTEKVRDARELDKSFSIEERINNNRRIIYSTPVVCMEIQEDLTQNVLSLTSINGRWVNLSKQLSEGIRNTEEFCFLFRYAFPMSRIMSLMMIYSITHLASSDSLRELFDGTKQQLKSLFQTLLNGGDYRYKDKYVDDQGGNAGMMKLSQNASNTNPKVEGLSLASIAAKTPLFILKGLVEQTDPNIGIARKIVDGAALAGKDLPIIVPSILQLPMNVFPPLPFGPGIGMPITPLGFIYLGLNIDSQFKSAQGRQASQARLNDEFGLNIGRASAEALEKCLEDNEEE